MIYINVLVRHARRCLSQVQHIHCGTNPGCFICSQIRVEGFFFDLRSQKMINAPNCRPCSHNVIAHEMKAVRLSHRTCCRNSATVAKTIDHRLSTTNNLLQLFWLP